MTEKRDAAVVVAVVEWEVGLNDEVESEEGGRDAVVDALVEEQRDAEAVVVVVGKVEVLNVDDVVVVDVTVVEGD